MDTIRNAFAADGARKILIALLTATLVALNKKLGLGFEPTEITEVVAIGVALILGLAIHDHGRAMATSTPGAVADPTPMQRLLTPPTPTAEEVVAALLRRAAQPVPAPTETPPPP